MASLCKECGEQDQWLPTRIDTIRSFLGNLICDTEDITYAYELKSNLAYNIQYLQYLEYTSRNLKLTSVLWTMTVKNIIVTGIGLVEAVLYYIVRVEGLHKENHWKLLRKVPTNEFDANGDRCKLENHLFIKLDSPLEEEMSLDSMLKKVEKRKLLGSDNQLYSKLNYLRRLRNRVHLHLVEAEVKTDWHAFNNNELALIKEVLLSLLTSERFCEGEEFPEWPSFLRPSQP